MKARLASLENRKKMIQPEDVNKPTLRKTQTADSNAGQNGQSKPETIVPRSPSVTTITGKSGSSLATEQLRGCCSIRGWVEHAFRRA